MLACYKVHSGEELWHSYYDKYIKRWQKTSLLGWFQPISVREKKGASDMVMLLFFRFLQRVR